MPSIDRRSFVRNTLKLGAGAVLAPSLTGLAACNDVPTGVAGPPLSKSVPTAGPG